MIETQAFLQFTLCRLIQSPRNDYETLFIDQSIIENNRAKLRIGKHAEFLNDDAFYVNSTHFCMVPQPSSRPVEAIEMKEWPVKFDSNNFGHARSLPPILTDMDINMMRAHTTQILQRSRIQQVII